jgi:hypothetical protein
MKIEHRHSVCAPNGYHARCGKQQPKSPVGAQATDLCYRSRGVVMNDEFFVAQLSWLSKLRRRDARWPHRLGACAPTL